MIKIPMHNQKCRSDAMKIAIGASGVESAAIKGDDKNQLGVTGDGIDAAELTMQIRKKIGYAFLESTNAAASGSEGGDKKKDGEGGDKKKETKNEAKMEVVWPTYQPAVPLYYHDVHYVTTDNDSKYRCSIM
ncbi:hypothetical protein EZV62_003218 [Acer yangbiense]|uniref:HMA domain-containing protein n=1 Tax=Acer yangbiense TaxID=1000413 RepID=A0A5C7IGA8_9ROSI|nr:hypothetical protein EZV62_003218 [Acer yangbiense]